jgi:hypothetical protein
MSYTVTSEYRPQRRFACNIDLIQIENMLVESFSLPEARISYLTALYQHVPSVYCLSLIQDLQIGTVSMGTAFKELKNRSLENAIGETTHLKDAATMKHLCHLYEFRTKPTTYDEFKKNFELSGYMSSAGMM